jgi:hypothetical protein
LWSSYYVEKQGMEMYNRKIFSKFQREIEATTRFSYRCLEVGKVYEVYPKPSIVEKQHRPRKYIVMTNLENKDFNCICCKFQKDGILCSHILKVIVEEVISEIPGKYLLDRWRKNDMKMVIHRRLDSTKTHELLRFNMLSRKSAVLNSKAAKKTRHNNTLCRNSPGLRLSLIRCWILLMMIVMWKQHLAYLQMKTMKMMQTTILTA